MSLLTSTTRIFQRAKRILFPSTRTYLTSRRKPLYKGMCLFEGGQGLNINGNMFVLARELSSNKRFSSLRGVFVVTEETSEDAQRRLQDYGIDMPVVERNSEDYQSYLARCEFLFTDNSFPPYFHKRPDQVYVNTWHGTPLKQLGRSNIENSLRSFANVQKNMLSADYLLFPNELTKDCFFKDYMIEKLFAGKYFMADYPRNDSLVNEEIRQRVRDEQGLHGRHVMAYMPTWRGTGRYADVEEQTAVLEDILGRLDACLTGDDVLYVNLHFLLGDVIDYEKYKHIEKFPSQYETYDFLAACDVLITDYSSVFFDYAVTRRKIVLFPYDLDEYLSSIGVYIPYESLPFPRAMTPEELADVAGDPAYEPYDEFYDTYCAYHTGHTSEDLLACACLSEEGLSAQENTKHEPVRLAYVRGVDNRVIRETVRAELDDSWTDDSVFTFVGRYRKVTAEFLSDLPEDIKFLALTTAQNMYGQKKIVSALAKRIPLMEKVVHGQLKGWYRDELNRMIPGVSIKSVLSYAPTNDYIHLLLGTLACDKVAEIRDSTLLYARRKKTLRTLEMGDFELAEGERLPLSVFSEEALRTYFNRSSNARLLTRHNTGNDQEIGLSGLMLLHTPAHIDRSKLSITLPDDRVIGTLTPVLVHGVTSLQKYDIHFALEDANTIKTTNELFVRYTDEEGRGLRYRIRYNKRDGRRSTHKHCKLLIDEPSNTTLYFRQGEKNFLVMTSRSINQTDYPRNARRMRVAYLLSLVPLPRHATVLYEKMSSRYEESASVVYERLIDLGVKDAYYILDAQVRDALEIPEKYKRNIVAKDSFKHYYLFFTARSFIGTERLPHAIELRSNSRAVRKRINDPTINYVFLQHGVMYMVSLDSSSRTLFRPHKTTTGLYRVVTSSKLEKNHFITRGRHEDEMVYVCGLPKFDRNQWHEKADKIIVMPTWRPWEANAARLDFEDTGYYRLMNEIYSAIPAELHDKVVLIAHPLFQQYLEGKEFALRKYLDTETSYDELLRDAKVLITDYSSIAYDAYYRGTNVIFYWKDKDECMEAYGEGTELMINENNVFGDVCYDADDLRAVLDANYEGGHTKEYDERYQQIVEFHDGKNTDRLIEMLRADGII